MDEATQELAVIHGDLPLTVEQIHAQVQVIQRVMANEMQPGIHYGKIPGCGDKEALLKPGADKLCMTFRLAPKYETEDLGENGEVRIRVRAKLYTIQHGLFVGEGVGEGWTLEDKYAWESPKSDAHFEATPADRRRIKYTKDGEYQQVRANVADRSNTVLKMSKKRALVDAVLTATAASDMFTQDLDDDDTAEMVRGQEQKPAAKPKVDKRKAAPTLPYGHSKGKQINDPSVPTEELQTFVTGKRNAIKMGKVAQKFLQSDALLCEAIEAELQGRQAAPLTVTETAKEQDPLGEMDDGIWAKFVAYCEDECHNSYDAVCAQFQATNAGQIGVDQRWKFHDAVIALVEAKKKTK